MSELKQMLDYIKQQLAQQQQHVLEHAVTVSEASEEQMDNAILEYAHLFDDMDDLTMEGANELRERPILDIPLEDDIELDSIEMSLTSNRVMDIPADIAAMEGAYSEQKTYNDFYQEAYKTVTKLPRENEAHFVERVKDVAEVHYNAYMEYVIQEGLFGNDFLRMNDDRIQKNAMLNFGPYKTNSYMTKVPVEYETDNNHMVNIQQTRAIPLAESYCVFEGMGDTLKSKLYSEQNIYCDEVWDVATPTRVIVPKFDGDYRCIVEFDVEDGRTTYVEWNISESDIRSSTFNESAVMRPTKVLKNSEIYALHLESKDDYIEEAYVAPVIPATPSRWDLDKPVYIEENTKGEIFAKSFGWAMLGAAGGGLAIGLGTIMIPSLIGAIMGIGAAGSAGGAIGGAIGGAAGGVASMVTTPLGAIAGGLSVGLGTNYHMRKGADEYLCKNVTKCIIKANSFIFSDASKEDYNVTMKKFKKANKKLISELHVWIPKAKQKKKNKYNKTFDEFNTEEFRTSMKNLLDVAEKLQEQVNQKNAVLEKSVLENYIKYSNEVLETIFVKKDLVKKEAFEEIITVYDVIQEMAEMDFYQEAIDFGGGDNADAPPEGDNNATNDASPAGDASTPNDASGDQSGASSVDAGGGDNSQPTAVNDVSDAVASKVSNEANKNSADLGMDAPPTFDSNPDVQLDLDGNGGDAGNGEDVNNLEPNMSGDTSNDMGTTDNFDTPTVDDSANMDDPNMTDVNNELGGDVGNGTDMNGDTNGNMGEDLGGGSMENIDDMSIDDLLAKGEEKLKGMSIGQLKDFLNDGLGDETTATTESVDNSIGNRLNVAIRRCLGTLNSSNKSVDQIVTEFSKESKKLNTVLGQADRSSNFDESTKTSLRKCNQSLTNLRMKLKANPSDNEKKQIVNLIKEFANDSKNIVNYVEKNSNRITMEYAMGCETDEFGIIIQETVSYSRDSIVDNAKRTIQFLKKYNYKNLKKAESLQNGKVVIKKAEMIRQKFVEFWDNAPIKGNGKVCQGLTSRSESDVDEAIQYLENLIKNRGEINNG